MRFMAVLLLLLGLSTQAADKVESYNCQLVSEELSGKSLNILLAKQSISGPARFECLDRDGSILRQNVKVELTVYGLGLGVAQLENVSIQAMGLTFTNPNELFGTYPILEANAIGGNTHDSIGLTLGFDFQDNEFDYDFNIITTRSETKGLAFNIMAGTLKLSKVEEEPIPEEPEPTPEPPVVIGH